MALCLPWWACQPKQTTTPPPKASFVKQNIFSPIDLHTHGSTVVELPNGDLLAAWFQGSGERWADDVAIMGARLQPADSSWSEPFVMADVPDFPDVNPVLFLDGDQRLWLVWYTVLANQWETSLPKYRISEDYLGEGAPTWQWQDMIHVKPGGPTERGIQPNDAFVRRVKEQMDAYERYLQDSLPSSPEILEGWQRWREAKRSLAAGESLMASGYLYAEDGSYTRQKLGYPLARRMGWQTKNKALVLPSGRIILPLYSDGLGFSLNAITNDGGQHWQFSEPLVGFENIQASMALGADGRIHAYMRDNGPPPQRLQYSVSRDQGMSWSPVRDSELPNPGAGADVVTLANGHWVMAYNDTEDGRHSLAVSLSTNEGHSWDHTRHLERDLRPREQANSSSYPSIIQGVDGHVHVVYSQVERVAGQKMETIRYARLTESWIRQGHP